MSKNIKHSIASFTLIDPETMSTPVDQARTPPTTPTTTNNTPRSSPITVNSYSSLKKLEASAQSQCFLATKQNKEQVVLKVSSAGQEESFSIEKATLLQLDHPRIVKCFGLDAVYNNALVLEYAPQGDLMSLLMDRIAPKNITIPESLVKTLAKQLFQALEYCGSQKIMHRDVKPENIFLDENFCIKLGDFGLASSSISSPVLWKNRPVGTVGYMSPEVHNELDRINHQRNPILQQCCHQETSDVWSAGVVLFIMLYGVPPFGEMKPTDWWYNKIQHHEWAEYFQTHQDIYGSRMKNQNNKSFYPKCSDQVKDLLRRMLCVDPLERCCTFREVLQHPWFTTNEANCRFDDLAFGYEMHHLLGLNVPLTITIPTPTRSPVEKSNNQLNETKTVVSIAKHCTNNRQCGNDDNDDDEGNRKKRRRLNLNYCSP